jgi:beta-lactamase regulating signal transducer with metallopeptidase domain
MTDPLFLESLVRANVLLALIIATVGFRFRNAPALRHALLLAGLVVVLVLPGLAYLSPSSPLAMPMITLFLGNVTGPTPVEFGPHLSGGVPATGEAMPILVTIGLTTWAAGAAVLLVRTLAGLAGLAELRRSIRVVGPELSFDREGVRIIVSPVVAVPAAVGVFHPTVLLPSAAVQWSEDEREAVLAHEFAHIRRGDTWTLVLAAFIRAVHWPNPLVWIAHRQLRTASEEACDLAALSSGLPARGYANLLIRTARTEMDRPMPDIALGMSRRSGLWCRVRALMVNDGRADRRDRRVRAVASVAVVAICLAITPSAMDAAADWARRFDIGAPLASQILEAAEAERVEPALAFGLVSVESGFEVDRVSDGGAVGLTQILPRTALTLDHGVTEEALHDPETNLRLGFRLLYEYLARFGGSRERALLAYHRGPSVAERFRAAESPLPAPVLRVIERTATGQVSPPSEGVHRNQGDAN